MTNGGLMFTAGVVLLAFAHPWAGWTLVVLGLLA